MGLLLISLYGGVRRVLYREPSISGIIGAKNERQSIDIEPETTHANLSITNHITDRIPTKKSKRDITKAE